MSRKFPEALTAPIRYRTLSLSDRGHVNLRLTFSVLRQGGSTRAVVATVPASADADYDNGAVVRGTRGSRSGDGDHALAAPKRLLCRGGGVGSPGRATIIRANLYSRCPHVVMGLRFSGDIGGTLLPYKRRTIQDVACGLRRIPPYLYGCRAGTYAG
jgi:hypothetical protein